MGWIVYGVGILALLVAAIMANDADSKARNFIYPLMFIWAIGGAIYLSDGKNHSDDCTSYGSLVNDC